MTRSGLPTIASMTPDKGSSMETKPGKMSVELVCQIQREAEEAGVRALKAAVPNPMVVEDRYLGREYLVEGGACGFAWVSVKSTSPFIRAMKRAGYAGSTESRRRGGWGRDNYAKCHSFWVFEGGQSVARKEAYARAFAAVLQKYGVDAWAGSRLD
jgi:hypothetical protein